MYRLKAEIGSGFYYADALHGDTAVGMIRFDYSKIAVLSNIQAYGSMYYQNEADYRGKGIAAFLLLSGLVHIASLGFQEFHGTLTPTPYSDPQARINALKFYKKVGVQHVSSHSGFDLRGDVNLSISKCQELVG